MVVWQCLTVVYGVRTMASRDSGMWTRGMSTYVNSEVADNNRRRCSSRSSPKSLRGDQRQSFAERIEQDLAQANLLLTVPEYSADFVWPSRWCCRSLQLLLWRSIPTVSVRYGTGRMCCRSYGCVSAAAGATAILNDQFGRDAFADCRIQCAGGFSLGSVTLRHVSKDSQEPN